MNLATMWIVTGLLQLLVVIGVSVVSLFFLRKMSGSMPDEDMWPIRVLLKTSLVIGAVIIVLNMIIGPLWLSTVDRWAYGLLGGLSATATYTTIRRASKTTIEALMAIAQKRLQEAMDARP